MKVVNFVLRVVHSLNISPEMQDNPIPRLKDFISNVIVKDPAINAKYEAVR